MLRRVVSSSRHSSPSTHYQPQGRRTDRPHINPPSSTVYHPLACHTLQRNYSKKPECDPKRNYYAKGEVKQVRLITGEMADVGSAAHIWEQTTIVSEFVAKHHIPNIKINVATLNVTKEEPTPRPK
jgi:hypothetical protein